MLTLHLFFHLTFWGPWQCQHWLGVSTVEKYTFSLALASTFASSWPDPKGHAWGLSVSRSSSGVRNPTNSSSVCREAWVALWKLGEGGCHDPARCRSAGAQEVTLWVWFPRARGPSHSCRGKGNSSLCSVQEWSQSVLQGWKSMNHLWEIVGMDQGRKEKERNVMKFLDLELPWSPPHLELGPPVTGEGDRAHSRLGLHSGPKQNKAEHRGLGSSEHVLYAFPRVGALELWVWRIWVTTGIRKATAREHGMLTLHTLFLTSHPKKSERNKH